MNVTQEIYQNNKKYICQRCGNCCRWPGVVKLTDEDTDRIAAFLGIGADQFIAEYTEVHPQRICLVLKSRANGECLFLEGKNICKINPVKPVQCNGFPNKWNFSGWRDVCEAIEAENT
jgi:Fe-S-cluster containining protein